jgi:hypothetical protein
MFRTPPNAPAAPEGWWNSRVYIAVLLLLAALPLIRPDIPPLTDLMGHMGRYRVELADPASPLLTRFYDFKWAVMGNLGVDLLIVPLSKIFGLELGVKLIVLAIPPLTALGMLWIAREVHGRVPATAVFALPLIYGFPFQWGFVNFALSMALALNAFALWLRLGRMGRIKLRAALFVPIGAIIWFAHSFGWGVLGLLAFSAEFVRYRDYGKNFIVSAWHGGLACLPLAPPLLLMLAWRSGTVSGQTTDWFNWAAKFVYFLSTLRNHWMQLDLFSMILLVCLAVFGLLGMGLRMNRTLGHAAVVLIVTFILLPRIALGSAYTDMRLAPFMLAVAILGLLPKTEDRRWLNGLALAAFVLFAVRIGISTVRFAEVDRNYGVQLQALDHVPRGSRIFVLVDLPCLSRWDATRMDHLGAMAIVRREAFVNGQWSMPGAQLLTIKYAPAKGFAEDPTQILRPLWCRAQRSRSLENSLARFPRNAFDFVWLIDARPDRWPHQPDLVQVWHGPRSGALYRVVAGSATAASETPNGKVRPATQ